MSTKGRLLYQIGGVFVFGLGLAAVVLLFLQQTRALSVAQASSPAFGLNEPASAVNLCPPGSPLFQDEPLILRQVEVSKQTGSGQIITRNGDHLERDGQLFEAKGTNYYPKDFAWCRLWLSYTVALPQIQHELDLFAAMGGNTVRIFLPYNLFTDANPSNPYLGYLTDFLDELESRSIVAIVTLFDFYPTYSSKPYQVDDYITSTQHISTVINTIGITNSTVLAWDIKNEIDRDYKLFTETMVKAWAVAMISYTRQLDSNHLITMGFYGAVPGGTLCYDPTVTSTLVYSPAIAAEFARLVDIVSMHYFLSERCFEADLNALRALVGEQPVLLEEFGLHTLADPPLPCETDPGNPLCDDPHTEIEQAAYYNALLSLGEAYNLAGSLFWTLNDFTYILKDTQLSHHCQGILRNDLIKICEMTTTVAYTEKPAADVVRRHFEPSIFYLDLFNSWVATGTNEPPPGWIDNFASDGLVMRGYDLSNALSSHTLGHVAAAKAGGTGTAGFALSPHLQANITDYPILAGEVYSYSIRDGGADSVLHIGVKEADLPITRLLTLYPTTTLPFTFSLDLSQSPLNWAGPHAFQIALELVPQDGDGYSATYEFDWIALRSDIRCTSTHIPASTSTGVPSRSSFEIYLPIIKC